MDPLQLSGQEFAALLDAGEAHERVMDAGAQAVLVEGHGLPATLDPGSMARLQTLAAVVIGLVEEPMIRPPAWSDLAVPPGSPELESAQSTVETNPLASITLAVLLRTGGARTIPEGLAAESMAYGLLQHGPEFARWRRGHPARPPSEFEDPAVIATREGDQLSITLDRPRVLNAFSAGMRDELVAALHVAAVDPTVTSVVLRGSGDAFCSGGDLNEFGSRPDAVTAHLVRLRRNAGRSLAEVADKTTVHIHGSTVGSGIELAAFAHRVVAARSTRISLPELHLGLIPGAGGTVSLPRRIGRHATMLLALALPSIDADTALTWGLVDELEP
jgi:hypothetical protein